MEEQREEEEFIQNHTHAWRGLPDARVSPFDTLASLPPADGLRETPGASQCVCLGRRRQERDLGLFRVSVSPLPLVPTAR